MKKNTKIVIFLTGIAIIILVGLFFIGADRFSPEENLPVENVEDYPDFLMEGVVTEVDTNIIKLKADTFLIKEASSDLMEKNIIFNDDTECISYKKDIDEIKIIECSEIKENDRLVVVTIESTREKIDELEEFIAVKITKMLPGTTE